MRPFLAALLLTPLSLAIAPTIAAAEPVFVGPCTPTASAENLVEPWTQNTATYGNGAIRVALLDTAEPAAAAVHLMVLSPPMNELGLRGCKLVSLTQGSGFYDIDFAGRSADYDAGTGLTLRLPAQRFVPDTGLGAPAVLTVTINQRTGEIAGNLK